MRKYTLTTDSIRRCTAQQRQVVWDWCVAEKAPDYNAIVRIDLIPSKKVAVYHLATSVGSTESGSPYIKTMPFEMPIKNKPTWVDLCVMTEDKGTT